MTADGEVWLSPQPFWFADRELLTNVLRAEIDAVTQLLAKYPELPDLFDAPEATVPQRASCFALLAHRRLMEMIYEAFTERYEQSPSLGDIESNALRRTHNLVAADAPSWASEMNNVVELLPQHILELLPEPLQTEGWYTNDPEKDEAKRSAATTLGTSEQIQAFTEQVIGQQWQRLLGRWPTTVVSHFPHIESNDATHQPIKQKAPRKRDKQRIARYQEIAEIADISANNTEFLQTMDERKVKPQPTWSGWPDSWVLAYKDPRLRKLIHQDKSRAIGSARSARKK